MQVEGIKGDVTTEGHKGEIALLTANLSNNLHVKTSTGLTRDRQIGMIRHGEIPITKNADMASSELHRYFYENKLIPKVTIHACYGDTKASPRMTLTLYNVLISEASDEITPDGQVIESYSLNYTKIEKRYAIKDKKGNPTNPTSVGYDVSAASVL